MNTRKITMLTLLLVVLTFLIGCGKDNTSGGKPTTPGEEFLPTGSVVTLKDSDAKIVVVGYAAQQLDAEEITVWDYSGALYPTGVLSPDELYLFNHDMIDTVVHMGYSDSEFQEFLPVIHQALEESK